MKAKFTKEDIIAKVIDLRLNHSTSTKNIINYIHKDLGFSKSQAYQYLHWAREEIKEQYSLMNPVMIEEAIGQYEDALEQSRLAKDWVLWNSLRRELNKIQGNYAAQRIDHTTNGKDMTITSVDIHIITDKNDLDED